jgi:heme exporter protein D
MNGLEEFFHMGGYATYVWGAYGITLVVLVANVLAPAVRAREIRRGLARQARLHQERS